MTSNKKNPIRQVNTKKRWWGLSPVNGRHGGEPYFPLFKDTYPTADSTLYTADTARLTADNEEP